MPSNRIILSVNELVRKMLDGERDFSHICLVPGSDIPAHPHFSSLQEYLRQQFSAVPAETVRLNFTYAELKGVNAAGMYLAYVQASGADLSDAVFEGAVLRRARFVRTAAAGINLRYAFLDRADFRYAALDGADVLGAAVSETDFSSASMRGIQGLSSVKDLGAAYFSRVELPDNLRTVYEKESQRLRRKNAGLLEITPFS